MVFLIDILRFALAGVFAIAGLTKLRHWQRTREDFEALGLPSRIVPAVSFWLPIIELAVAATLMIEPLTDVGAMCALGLLSLFTAVIAINLWRGRHPACACFGSLSRNPIGARTLARNVMLMATTGMLLIPPSTIPVVFDGQPTTSALVIASMLVGCVILFQAWWAFQLWRQQGRLLLRIEQLEQRSHITATTEPQPAPMPRLPNLNGQPAPALTLHDVTGRRIDLQSLRGTPAVLLFLDSTCKHCRPLLSRLRTWQPAAHAIVVLGGQQPRVLDFAPGIAVVTDDAPSAMQSFGVLSTPVAIVIDADGVVAEPPARGNTAVAELMDRLTELAQETQEVEAQHEFATV